MSSLPSFDWPAAATRLAAAIPRERLDPDAVAWMEAAGARRPWAVGFSGGADSLALLLLVWAHWPARRRRLKAFHFDHRLRGAESRGDATFCRAVCAKLGVEFVTSTWRRRGTERPSEAEARAARMGFFQRHARVVLLGHQQDDIAEALFMRIARGSGTGGLAAPRPVQRVAAERVHVRPLLALAKAEITTALRTAGVPWREDSSNAEPHYFRNRVRREVIPAWVAAAQRDALAGAARSRRLLEEDDAALEAWLDDLAPIERGQLRLGALAGRPRALWRRALHRWLAAQPAAGELSRQAFEALLAALQAGRPTRHSLGREGFAVIDRERLRFVRVRKRERTFHRAAN